MTHVERQALGVYLFAVHVSRDITEMVISKLKRVRSNRTKIVRVLHHGEEETLGYWPQHGVVYGKGFRFRGKYKRLECESSNIISRQCIFRGNRLVRQRKPGVRSDTFDKQPGKEKLEDVF